MNESDVSSVVERSIAVRMVTRSIRVRRFQKVAWRSWLTRDVYTVKIAGSNPAVTSFSCEVAQRKRAGPITQRSVDRNHPLLRTTFMLLT